MNFFEIDFLTRMATLLKEAFKFKKYKAMHPVWAVFTGIFMLPIVLASFGVIAVLSVLGFVFSFVSYPVKYMHDILNKEGKEVKHATQAILYFISWPWIFLSYALVAVLLFVLIPIYAVLAILTYIWTLGGFKFHLFVNYTDDISIEVKGRYVFLPIVYVGVGALVTFFIPLVHGFIHYAELYSLYLEKYFTLTFFGGIYPSYIGIHIAFTVLYALIGFARHPREKDDK